MRKKGLPEVIERAIMSFYHEAKMNNRKESDSSEEPASGICVAAAAFRDCSVYNHGECKKRLDE